MSVLPLYTALQAGCDGAGLLGTWPEACKAGIEAYHEPPSKEIISAAVWRVRAALMAFRNAIGGFMPIAVWRQADKWAAEDEAAIRTMMAREVRSRPAGAQPTHLLRAATADWAGYRTGPLTPAELEVLGDWFDETSWWLLYDDGHAYWLAYEYSGLQVSVISRVCDAIGLPVLDWVDGRDDEPLMIVLSDERHVAYGIHGAADFLLDWWPHPLDVDADAREIRVIAQDGVDYMDDVWRLWGELAAERIAIEEGEDGSLIPDESHIDEWEAETRAPVCAMNTFRRRLLERLEDAAENCEFL